MFSVRTRVVNGTVVEIERQDGTRKARYTVYAEGREIVSERTIVRAMRATNAFFGQKVFNMDEVQAHG